MQMAVVVGCHFVFKVRKSYKTPSFGNVHQMAGDVLSVLKKSVNHLALGMDGWMKRLLRQLEFELKLELD